MKPKFDIEVHLTGMDGNAMGIIAKVMGAMRRANVSGVDRDAFAKEAMSGDYDNVLRTCMKWVNVR